MKIIGFAGSPRIGGNSDLLLDRCLAGAADDGAEVEKIYLDQQDIAPCRACEACRQDGAAGCIVEDDMQAIYQKMQAADVWVLATPVYWWGPSAQLKLMVDRWYGFYRHCQLAGKKAALIITMGDDEAKTAHPTIEMFADAFEYLKMPLLPPVVASVHDRGAILECTKSLAAAYELGRQCARS